MKLDHHEFRMSMGMFELTPDQITNFAKWLLEHNYDIGSFLDSDMSVKRAAYNQFLEESTQIAVEE